MPMPKSKEGGPVPSKTIQLADFSKGLIRTGARDGIDPKGLWESTNAQVIGPGHIQTLVGPGPSIANYTGNPVVSLWGVMIQIGGVESARLIAILTNGAANAIDPATGVATGIGYVGAIDPTARVTMWRDTHVLFAGKTSGFSSWDGTTFVTYPTTFVGTTTNASSTVTWTGGPMPASAIVAGMGISGTGIPAGTFLLSVTGSTLTIGPGAATASGTGVTLTLGEGAPKGTLADPASAGVRDVATFEGRVWLVSGNRGIIYSGPGSFALFGPINAGGALTMPDSVFPGPITTIRAAIQLLWVFGPGAINTISNVQVVSGITIYQNENLVAGTGTAQADSVQPLFRTMVFLSPPGVYAILGATPQKLSDPLDGLMPDVVPVGSAPGAVFNLNALLVYAVLVDLAGQRRLLIYSRPTWFVADQGADLMWITSLVRLDGQIQCWGTNGTRVFQLFAGETADYDIRLKHFDFDMFTRRDTLRRIAVQAELAPTGNPEFIPDVQVEVENESSTAIAVGGVLTGEVTWVNDTGALEPWANATAGEVTWSQSGNLIFLSEVKFSGNLLSAHIYGRTSVPLIIGSVALEVGLGGEWTFAP